MNKFLCFLLLLFCCSCNTTNKIDYSNRTPDEKGFLVKVGDKAPNFKMTMIDGTQTSLKALKGKVVVLQFTASWCGVCRKEMPHLENEVWLPNKDKDFVLIGVDRDEPLEKVQSFIEKMETTYPVALDPGADIFGLFAGKKTGVTRNIVIDKKGKIVFMTRLFKQNEFDAMKEKINSLL